jgi:hypothetical protein
MKVITSNIILSYFCTLNLYLILTSTFKVLVHLNFQCNIHLVTVHERDVNTDFLLILVKHLLKQDSKFKVVLMSATLNAKIFSEYFCDFGCNSIIIPGRAFPVTAFFLEDALSLTGYEPEPGSDCIFRNKPLRKSDEQDSAKSEAQKRAMWSQQISAAMTGKYKPTVIKTLLTMDESVVNTALIVQLVSKICSDPQVGAVLVFVPGIAEIRDIVELLSHSLDSGTTRVLPLHSSLSTVEQQRVFEIPPSTVRKIVVATNIAETSITIPDVVSEELLLFTIFFFSNYFRFLSSTQVGPKKAGLMKRRSTILFRTALSRSPAQCNAEDVLEECAVERASACSLVVHLKACPYMVNLNYSGYRWKRSV